MFRRPGCLESQTSPVRVSRSATPHGRCLRRLTHTKLESRHELMTDCRRFFSFLGGVQPRLLVRHRCQHHRRSFLVAALLLLCPQQLCVSSLLQPQQVRRIVSGLFAQNTATIFEPLFFLVFVVTHACARAHTHTSCTIAIASNQCTQAGKQRRSQGAVMVRWGRVYRLLL